VGGLERAASPAEECGREKGEAPARAEWRGWRRGRGAAGAGLRWVTVWGIVGLRGVRSLGKGKSGGSTTLLPAGAATLRYARQTPRKKGHPNRRWLRPPVMWYAIQM